MVKMHSLISKKHAQLISDVLSVARKKVKRRGKTVKDLRFAKRTTKGYAFFEVGHEVWEMLHEIAQEVFHKNPQYELAFIIELCSEVINTEEADLPSLGVAV